MLFTLKCKVLSNYVLALWICFLKRLPNIVIMIKVDMTQIDAFAKNLKKLPKKAADEALARAINSLAFDARSNAVDIIENDFTLRNKFTIKQLQVAKAKPKHLTAILGHTQQYMADQESGATLTPKGKEGVRIPTSTASFEGRTARPRQKLPRGKNAMKKIKLKHARVGGKSNKQQLLLKVRDAVGTGRRYIFHDFGGRKKKGIFRVKGGGKRGLKRRGWPRGATLNMIFDMSQPTVRIPKREWLRPAVAFTSGRAKSILTKQLKQAFTKRKYKGSKR